MWDELSYELLYLCRNLNDPNYFLRVWIWSIYIISISYKIWSFVLIKKKIPNYSKKTSFDVHIFIIFTSWELWFKILKTVKKNVKIVNFDMKIPLSSLDRL